MKISVLSRSRRILNYLENYHDLLIEHEYAKLIKKKLSFTKNDELLGLYETDKNLTDNLILVTDFGLHILNGEWCFVRFNEIVKAEMPEEKKNIEGFNIYLKDGTKVWLPVRGVKNGRFYDAFEFIRFIDRVISDCSHVVTRQVRRDKPVISNGSKSHSGKD